MQFQNALAAGPTWETIMEYLDMPIIRVAIILLAALVLWQISRLLTTRMIARIDSIESTEKRERDLRRKTLIGIANSVIGVTILVVALFVSMSELGIELGPILAAAGVAGLAIGFGAQSLVKDFFTGFFILLENQFRVGDVVRIGSYAGIVEKMTMRTTVLRDIQGLLHIIPNGEITAVSNMTFEWSRMLVEVGIAYKESVDNAIKVLEKICEDFYKDEKWGSDLLEEPQVAGVEALADSQVTIRVLGKTKPLKQWDIMREFRRRVKNRFDEVGIEIPFPHRTVYMGKENGESVPEPEKPAA